jgi:hypothetical protein
MTANPNADLAVSTVDPVVLRAAEIGMRLGASFSPRWAQFTSS